MKSCPVCHREYAQTLDAFSCWLRHERDLTARLTLQEMGRQLGVTRERARQLANSLGETRRAGQRKTEPVAASPAVIPRVTLRAASSDDADALKLERRRAYYRERERDPRRKEYKRRRHTERWANDPAYRELKRAKARRKAARRKQRTESGQ